MAIQVEVRSRGESFNGEVWRAIVTTPRGRCYRCDWTGVKPTEGQVVRAWREDRRSFDTDPTGGAAW